MSLLRQGKAWALTIYLGESDQWRGQPAYVEILHFLRTHGCAGATATRAIAGYGAGAVVHAQKGLRWSSDAPIVIQVIDQPQRLERLLPQLQEMVNGGLMTLQDIEVLKYTHAHHHGLPARVLASEIMERQLLTIAPETPARTILEQLLYAPFRMLPVVDAQQHLLGIISTGDLIAAGVLPVRRGLMRIALETDTQTAASVATTLTQARQSAITAAEIMNRQVRTLQPGQGVREVARIMLETGLRRLPVVDEQQRLQGVITRTDLLHLIVSSPVMSRESSSRTQPLPLPAPLASLLPQQRPVAAFVDPDVATVTEATALDEVLALLLESSAKRVIVIDAEQHIKGIISDIDMLARVQDEARPGLLSLLTSWARLREHPSQRLTTGSLWLKGHKGRTAADVMNREVVTISASLPVQEAVEVLLTSKRKILPVLDDQGQLLGIVGRSQLLHLLLEGDTGDE